MLCFGLVFAACVSAVGVADVHQRCGGIVVADDLAVRRRSDEWTVEHGAVGRRSDRLAVELQLLLGVPQLKGTGALVRRRLLAV